jgi:hypothetical protein
MGGGERKQSEARGHTRMIHLMSCKNFYKFHDMPTQQNSKTIQKLN